MTGLEDGRIKSLHSINEQFAAALDEKIQETSASGWLLPAIRQEIIAAAVAALNEQLWITGETITIEDDELEGLHSTAEQRSAIEFRLKGSAMHMGARALRSGLVVVSDERKPKERETHYHMLVAFWRWRFH